jgi:hypothetical protein
MKCMEEQPSRFLTAKLGRLSLECTLYKLGAHIELHMSADQGGIQYIS